MDPYEKQFSNRSKISLYWHNKSSDLASSAQVLWNAMEADNSHQITCYSTYRMLFGMSLEALLKAHCVAQKLDNPRIKNSHNLTEIANIAGIRLNKKDNKILDVLSEFVVWDGRYPTPKSATKLKRHWDNLNSTALDKTSLGGLEIMRQNDSFKFENLFRIWRLLSDEYFEKHQNS